MAWEPNWVALRLERELVVVRSQLVWSCVVLRTTIALELPQSDGGAKRVSVTYPRNDPTGVLATETM